MKDWTVKLTVPNSTMPRVVFVRAYNASQAAKQAAVEAGLELSLVFSVEMS